LEIPLFETVGIRWRAARGKRERRRKRSSSPSFKDWFFKRDFSFLEDGCEGVCSSVACSAGASVRRRRRAAL